MKWTSIYEYLSYLLILAISCIAIPLKQVLIFNGWKDHTRIMIFIILWMTKLMVQNLTLIKIAQSFGINIVLILAFINIILRHIALLCAEKSFHCTLRISFVSINQNSKCWLYAVIILSIQDTIFILKSCKRNEIMLRNVARHYH